MGGRQFNDIQIARYIKIFTFDQESCTFNETFQSEGWSLCSIDRHRLLTGNIFVPPGESYRKQRAERERSQRKSVGWVWGPGGGGLATNLKSWRGCKSGQVGICAAWTHFSTMALLMIPHTFFIRYSLEIFSHLFSHLIYNHPVS